MKPIRTLFVAAIAALSFTASAQDYPSHAVKIIVPTAPGTGTDATARFIADRLSKDWTSGVVVENKVGANGNIAAEFVAKAAPDGYTLLMGFSGLFANKSLYKAIPYDPVKDFRMLIGVNELYLAIVVPVNSPYKSVKDLVEAAAKAPGKVSFGSAGSGSTTHLGPALLGSMANVQFQHVPYKGGGQAITDTISGQVDFAMTAIATAAPQLAGGRMRALAVSGSHRVKSLPNVPTLAETYPGYYVASATFLAAPAGTPDAVATKITSAVDKIIRTPEYQKFLEGQGFEPETTPPAVYQASKASDEVKHWAEIVRVTGAKVD